jgi:hypothetical protein
MNDSDDTVWRNAFEWARTRGYDYRDATEHADDVVQRRHAQGEFQSILCGADQEERAMRHWECILSYPEDGHTFVGVVEAPDFRTAAEVAEDEAGPGGVWEGTVPFVTSYLPA